jgi:ligand-binding sensor domain-containing protein
VIARLVFAAALLPGLLAGCSRETPAAADRPPPAAAKGPRVLETFNVGDDVYVRALAVDARRNALWVGTSLGAHEIDLATREPVHTFTRDNGLANEYVFAAFVDSTGGSWFGTNGGGASRYDGERWKTWFPMHGLADYWVYAFAEESPGVLWIGTWDGVNRFDIRTGKFERYRDELVNEWVYAVGVDSRKRVWFGTEGGVSMYDGSGWKEWTHKEGLGAPNAAGLPPSTNTGLGTRARHDLSVTAEGRATYNPSYVFCILIDKDDTVWAGTWGGGASHFTGGAWSNLTSRDGLAGDIVFSMARDAAGALWFGTDKGLSRYDGKSWQGFGTADGLPGGAVYALTTAPDGAVWAGMRGMVARLGYGK